MDFVQSLDPSKLVLVGASLSFILSGVRAPPYNFPLYLFGYYAQENSEAVQSLQTFTGLLGVSIIYDIVWMSTNGQHGFIRFLNIVLILLKLPTFLAFGLAARQRGSQFGGSLGVRGGDLSGPTVWSMPGGFTSMGRDGYQTVDDDIPAPPPQRTSVPPAAPAGPPQAPNAAPGAYQSV
ncbi:hypothetical protein K435DRAFT_961660 [Dendrothele bispora CBS 962.96]|uniref:Uncharacterized protein n=1 Tax=Dendrothele bispora (strain CBS 962.96) TaxID=1314807 RepID=A0A4S8MPL9_DENBC|nr:hypothetical protein K435DRAFT_961660 [Dendrothele bispora CBS 962.96]